MRFDPLYIKLTNLFGERAETAPAPQNDADAMMHAIYFYKPEKVQDLLGKGVSPNAPLGPDHIPPLTLALWNKDIEIMKILLKAGADPNARMPTTGKTALMDTGAIVCWLEMVDLLLENGANPHVRDNENMTAFMHTALAAETMAMDPTSHAIAAKDASYASVKKYLYDYYIKITERLQKAEKEIAPLPDNGSSLQYNR